MAKETSFLDAAGDAIRTALTPVLGKKKREDGSEAETVSLRQPRRGAALLNPVAATGAALLGTTQDAGRGDYAVEKGSIQDLIRNGSAATRAIGLQQAEEAKKKMLTEAMRIYRTTK